MRYIGLAFAVTFLQRAQSAIEAESRDASGEDREALENINEAIDKIIEELEDLMI